MKLTHFVVLAVVLVGAAIFGLVKACHSNDPMPAPSVATAPTPTPATPTPIEPATPVEPAEPTAAPLNENEMAARAWDAEVLAWRLRGIRGEKEKDVTKGKAYKVNVYKDAGNATVNRAKVDLDRDDKFDEKYTFEPSKITLQRSSADNEKYDEKYHWTGKVWVRE